MNEFIDSFAYWLADFYLLSTVLLAAALAATSFTKQPVKRLAIAKSVLVAITLLAVLCALPGWSVIHLLVERASEPPTKSDLAVGSTRAVGATAPVALPVASADGSFAPRSLPVAQHAASSTWATVSLTTVFGCVQLAGSACVLSWLGLGALSAGRLVRNSRPAPIELSRMLAGVIQTNDCEFALLVSGRIDVPVAIGVMRPRVLLPQHWIDDRLAEELQTVLAHEVAHVQNGDLTWLAVGRSLLVLLWAQPLYWWLRRSLRLDQEALADAAAAELSNRHHYAEQLVAWARGMSAQPRLSLPAAMGLWEGPSQLRRRVALLLDERLTVLRYCSATWVAGMAVVLTSLAVLISFVTVEPTAAADTGIRALPSGPRVEILAIGTNLQTEPSQRWWRADGTPLKSAPFHVGGGSVTPSDNQSVRQFVMRTPGLPPDSTVRWRVIDMVGGGYWATVEVDGRESPPGYHGEVFCISQRQVSFGLRVDVATGDWATIVSSRPQGGSSQGLRDGKSVAFTQAFSITVPHWGDSTAAVVSDNYFDKDVRVVAIDESGKRHTAGRSSGASVQPSSTIMRQFDFPGLKPGQVDHFEFQTREFETVQFDDLPTEPDASRPSIDFQALEAEGAAP